MRELALKTPPSVLQTQWAWLAPINTHNLMHACLPASRGLGSCLMPSCDAALRAVNCVTQYPYA